MQDNDRSWEWGITSVVRLNAGTVCLFLTWWSGNEFGQFEEDSVGWSFLDRSDLDWQRFGFWKDSLAWR